jgi:hypothetical protein
MTARRRGLGAGAAALVLAGGLLAHALDEEGLLPGVHESERVREFGERGAARPLLYLAALAVAALVGAVVARSARARRTAPLLVLVVTGQATLFASFEVVARLRAGLDVAEMFAEPAFATGFAVQCLVAAAFVTLLLLAGRTLLALLAPPRNRCAATVPAHLTVAAPRVATTRPPARSRGRAPPYRTLGPSPTG